MIKKYIYILACLAIVLTACVYWIKQSSNSAIEARVGSLQLPVITTIESEVDLLAALASIDMVPTSSLRLKNEERTPFLQFIQTALANAQMPNKKDIYLSKSSVVWLVLQENWPSSKRWFKDPSIVADGENVSIKLIADRVLTLQP